MVSTVGSPFDELAHRYDAWYDRPEGRVLFRLEHACLAALMRSAQSPGLEVGVGSGRFAAALEIAVGIDPAGAPLRLAAERGVHSIQGDGEQLPFANHTFGLIAIVGTLCFADHPDRVLTEAHRVLRPGGLLIVGAVPADSAWGRSYQAKGSAGHPFYRDARLLTLAEHQQLIESATFEIVDARSTLLQGAGDSPIDGHVVEGAIPGAGFVAISATPR
jgi:ubiquinone/menaquinone biosynthesis C-methylase UbiE